MKQRALQIVVLSVLLSSCGREQHEVRTQSIRGKIVFTTSGAVGSLLRKTPCLESISIEDEAERPVWSIERETGFACRTGGFPVTFGQQPPGFRTTTNAQPLKRSVIYVISGDDARTSAAYSGGFRINVDGSVQSFATSDPEIQKVLSTWAAKEAVRNDR